MIHDPKVLAEVLVLLEATGLLNVKSDPNDPTSVLVSPSPKLVSMIEARGITSADCAHRCD